MYEVLLFCWLFRNESLLQLGSASYYNKLGDFFSRLLCGNSGWKRCLYHRSILSALSRLIKHSLLLGNSEIIFRQKNVPRQIIYSWVLDPGKAVAYKLHIWKEKYIFFLIQGYWVIVRFSFIYTLHDFLKEEIPGSKLTESFSYSFLVVVISTCHSFLCSFLIIYRLYTYRYHTLLVAIAGTTDLFHFEDNYTQVFVLTRSWIVFPAKLKEEKLNLPNFVLFPSYFSPSSSASCPRTAPAVLRLNSKY